MDNCCVVAATWRYASAEQIARYTVPEDRRAAELRRLKRRVGAQGLIYLATCNRAAFIFSAEPGATLASCRGELLRLVAGAGATRRVFRSWEGEGAVEHLYLVAAGLDSAQPGEREIRGQLRDALDEAMAAGTVDSELRRVVESALRAGKRVHRETGVGDGRTSLSEIAADVLSERAAKVPGPVALVGVAAMTETCAERLHGRGVPLVLVNRTRQKAEELAERTKAKVQERSPRPNRKVEEPAGRRTATSAPGRVAPANAVPAIERMSLDAFRHRPPAVTAALFATGAPGPVVDRRSLAALARAGNARLGARPLLVDMAIPADAAPRDAEAAGLERIGMDRINELAQRTLRNRRERTAEARVLIDEALDDFREETATRSVAGAIRAIGSKYQESLGANLDRLLQKELKGLSDAEREALRQWTATMAKRLSHLPVVGLRAVATEIGQEGVDAFLAAAAPELIENRSGSAAGRGNGSGDDDGDDRSVGNGARSDDWTPAELASSAARDSAGTADGTE